MAPVGRHHQVDRKLRIRLGIFVLIALVLLGLAAYDVVRGDLAWWEAVLTLVMGLGIGYLFGRAVKIRWHESEEKVITQMDLLGEFFTGAVLTAITLAAVSGILIGRFLGMRQNIRRTLSEERPSPGSS